MILSDREIHAALERGAIEKLKLPYRSRIAARVEGKSSLARLGLGIHQRQGRVLSGQPNPA